MRVLIDFWQLGQFNIAGSGPNEFPEITRIENMKYESWQAAFTRITYPWQLAVGFEREGKTVVELEADERSSDIVDHGSDAVERNSDVARKLAVVKFLFHPFYTRATCHLLSASNELWKCSQLVLVWIQKVSNYFFILSLTTLHWHLLEMLSDNKLQPNKAKQLLIIC